MNASTGRAAKASPKKTERVVSRAAEVANEFISLGLNTANVPPVDQMKLQKLLFYAHGWHLAFNNTPLFEEDFEAWPWGPVVRDVYYQTKGYGRSPITGKVSEITKIGDGHLDFRFSTPDGVKDPSTKEFVHAIWNAYKAYTGIELSNSTHARGEPWTIVKEQYDGDLSSKPTIPNELIEAVFKEKIEA